MENTTKMANTPKAKNLSQLWSAEEIAQQHGGAPKDTTLSMEQIRSAADVVVAAGTKKEGEGAKWMLLLLEIIAVADAPKADATEQENETL